MENKHEIETMVISCYVDQAIDNEEGKYDKLGHAELVVPTQWAKMMIEKDGWESVEDFSDNYVHDDTDGWVSRAIEDGVLLGLHLGMTGH